MQARRLHPESGTTLLELLVSLLVFSCGLLTIAGVQLVSLRSTQAAYFRTQATLLTTQAIEFMHSNRSGVDHGDYDDVAGIATAACFTMTGCTPGQMAGQHVLDWQARVAALLPGGIGIICLDATGNDGTATAPACDGMAPVYAVKIFWDDNRDGNANQRLLTQWQPR